MKATVLLLFYEYNPTTLESRYSPVVLRVSSSLGLGDAVLSLLLEV